MADFVGIRTRRSREHCGLGLRDSRTGKPQLAASIAVTAIFYRDGRSNEDAPLYVTVRVRNTGSVPVRLHSTFFFWRLRFGKTMALVSPTIDETGDDHVPQRIYPVVIAPNTSESIFLSPLEQFQADMQRVLDQGRFGRKVSAKRLQGIVYTDDGSRFVASFDREFREELLRVLSLTTT